MSGVSVARYYDAATAQFFTHDLLECMTRSAYGYVQGDPLDSSDPSGLMCWSFHCVVNDFATAVSIGATVVAVGAVVVATVVAAPEAALAVAAVAGTVSFAAGVVQTVNQCSQAIDTSCVADGASLALGGPLAPGFRTPIRGIISGIMSTLGDALSDVNGHPFLTNPSPCRLQAPGPLLPLSGNQPTGAPGQLV